MQRATRAPLAAARTGLPANGPGPCPVSSPRRPREQKYIALHPTFLLPQKAKAPSLGGGGAGAGAGGGQKRKSVGGAAASAKKPKPTASMKAPRNDGGGTAPSADGLDGLVLFNGMRVCGNCDRHTPALR